MYLNWSFLIEFLNFWPSVWPNACCPGRFTGCPHFDGTAAVQNSADASSLSVPPLQGSGEPPSQPPAPAHHRSLEKNPHSRSPRPSAVRPAGRLDPVQLLSHGAEQPPIGSNGPLTRPQSRPPLTSMKGLLSSLFKTLDPAASPFGN